VTIKIPRIYFLNNGVGGKYTAISSNAFWSSGQNAAERENKVMLEHIYLPSTITSIGSRAF
jgi:hypothetical protein